MTAEVELFEDRPLAPATPLPVAPASDIDSWVRVASDVIKLAGYVCETEFVPKNYRGNAPATAAAILAGRELNLPPFTALRHVHVVEGSPSLSAEYKRARVLAAGHELDIIELTTTRCKVQGRRRGSGKPPLEITFTIDDAKRAGLIRSRGAWETRPRRMLFARAATEVCDFLFADITNGLPTTELLEDGGDGNEFAGYAEAPQQDGDKPQQTVQRLPRRRAASPAKPLQAVPAPEPARPAAGMPPLPGEEDSGPAPSGQPAGNEPAAGPEPEPGSDRHRKLVGVVRAHFKRLGYTDDDDAQRLEHTAILAGTSELGSTNDLDEDELKAVADTLARCKNVEALAALLDATRQAGDGDA